MKTNHRRKTDRRRSSCCPTLPGKQPKATEKKAAGQVSRCEICKIVYGSKKDDAFQKEQSINAEYMGCGECEYWVHVICAGYNVNSQKDIDEIEFKCPKHTTKKEKMSRDLQLLEEPSASISQTIKTVIPTTQSMEQYESHESTSKQPPKRRKLKAAKIKKAI